MFMSKRGRRQVAPTGLDTVAGRVIHGNTERRKAASRNCQHTGVMVENLWAGVQSVAAYAAVASEQIVAPDRSVARSFIDTFMIGPPD
jgi:hypothetical protein